MAYVSPALFAMAARSLDGAQPLTVVAIPALVKKAGSIANGLTGVTFGATEENQLLDSFMRVPGAPSAQRPYYAPWDHGLWIDRQWAGRSSQRQRKARSDATRVFSQVKNQSGPDTWAIRPTAGQDLRDDAAPQVKLIDLAIWFGRDQAVADLSALLNWFYTAFGFTNASGSDLIGTIYVDGIPAPYAAEALSQQPLSAEDFAAILETLPPPLSITDPLDVLVASLEVKIRAAHFELPNGLVNSVMTAWLRGDLVVLVGQPGTGKTRFATLLLEALSSHLGIESHLVIPVHQEFDEAEFIGYEGLAGTSVLRPFTQRVLKAENPLDPQLVLLEEFNLATVEKYLSSVLIALQERSRAVALPAGESASLPRDIFAIATCNSYLDEETRTRLSYPTKRRASVLVMPNVLFEAFEQEGSAAISRLMVEAILQEQDEVAARVTDSRGSAFDGMRASRLGTVTSVSDLSTELRLELEKIVGSVPDSPEGASFFTLGLLRDVGLEITYADRNAAAELDCALAGGCREIGAAAAWPPRSSHIASVCRRRSSRSSAT